VIPIHARTAKKYKENKEKMFDSQLSSLVFFVTFYETITFETASLFFYYIKIFRFILHLIFTIGLKQIIVMQKPACWHACIIS